MKFVYGNVKNVKKMIIFVRQIGDNDILEIISFAKTGVKTLIKYTDKIDNEA